MFAKAVALCLFSSGALAEEQPRADDVPRALQTVVTGLRAARPVREAPTTITVLPRKELERAPSQTTDGVLRLLPSVATFRRASSLTADPSSQGVNLRGLGPSAISRSLVLLDGLPMNDAFGGWVYWRALPRLGLERIEIAQGGSSASHGNAALGGVIQLFSKPIREQDVELDLSGGNLETAQLSGRVAGTAKRVSLSVEGDVLRSGGYFVVESSLRGPVDQRAASRHLTGDARLDIGVTDALTVRFRARGFDEAQNGGTRFTTANVWTRQFVVGATWATEGAGTVEANVFSGEQRLAQERARVVSQAPGQRNVEFLSAEQNTPSSDLGASVVWSAPIAYGGGKHAIAVGADTRNVRGEARELFAAGGERISGGAQQHVGAFIQNLYRPSSRLDVLGALRLDRWSSFDGRRVTDAADGTAADVAFDDVSQLQLSPRLGARFQLVDALSLRANAYRAFRAPTLNELYRPFQVGAVVTESNPRLEAESVVGGELGAEISPVQQLHARASVFWNELSDPIINATTSSGRERQNLGHARVRGLELEGEFRPIKEVTALFGYTFVEPVVTARPDAPELVGLDLPQDPRHRLSAQLSYEHPRYVNAALFVRFVSQQFEDDRGDLPMAGYALLDLFVSRELAQGVSVFGAVENLLDARYLVGRAGADTIGAPRTFRLGLRLRSR